MVFNGKKKKKTEGGRRVVLPLRKAALHYMCLYLLKSNKVREYLFKKDAHGSYVVNVRRGGFMSWDSPIRSGMLA
ncbi:hypothetical protein TorRG33x02_188040 [Trema orientale]|uniref:Uncharacterized protein n=1 Tax=Trema orientale TaxID=63057 RepID=A0A2P5EIP9_TREOI|nr:hypothetical protein TorRG33x02_188040 [Trema orientale]